jgi:hypothetical protein
MKNNFDMDKYLRELAIIKQFKKQYLTEEELCIFNRELKNNPSWDQVVEMMKKYRKSNISWWFNEETLEIIK